tara:strand:- start:1739 stop:5746 length:4008 start_codon:yes stop_codon:yes gene_type:complete
MPFDQYGNYINPFESDEEKGRLAESPGLASVIGGLGAEVGIAGGAQALGAATGVGYVPIALAGGFLGSVVNQSINDEPFNLGRAVAASVVNLIPGAAGIKGASKAGTITKALNNAAKGLNKYGTKTVPGAIQREAFRGSVLGVSEITVENLINDGNLPTYDEVLKYGGFGGLIGGTLGGVLGSVQRKGLGKSLEQSAIDVTEDANKSWKTMSYQDKNDFLKQIGEDIVGDLPESELNNKFNKFVSLARRNSISEASLKALIYSRDPISGADVVQGNILTKMLNTVAPSTVFGKELNNQISAIQGMVDEADALGGRIRKEIKTELQKDPNSNIMEDIRRYVTSPHESGTYTQDILGSDHLLRGSRGRFVRKAKLPDYLSRIEADLNQWKAHRTKLQTELLEFVEPKTIDGFVGKDESIALRSILDESGGDISSKQSIAESIKLQNYLTQEYQLFDDVKYSPSKDSKKALINWMVKNDESISGAEYKSDATGRILKGEDRLRAQREAAEDYINRTYLRRSANPQNRVASSPSNRKIQDEFRTSDVLLNKNRSMPKELTDFLGAELKDPITGKPDVAENLFGTISKLAKRVSGLKAQEVLLRDLQQQGKLNIVSIDGKATEAPFIQFQNPKEVSFFNGTIVGNAPEEVVLAINEIVDSGMVNKATSEALDSTTRFVKKFKDIYGTLAGASKAVKVIASPIAYSTNAMGGAITALASGNFNLIGADLRKGIRMSLDEFGTMEGLAQAIGDPVSRAARKGLDAKQTQALIDDVGKMRKYGMMGADVASSDTVRALGDGSIGKFANKVFDPLSKSYQVTDNAFRYLVWKNNIDKFKRMFPKPAGMADARYLEEIERGAAFFTNDTYQNYNKLNKSLRQFSALGVVDPFISFTAELHRNLWNNVTSIIKMSGPAKLGGGTFGKGLGFSDELLANANRKAIQGEGTKRGVILAGITAGFGMGVKAYNESNGVDSEKMEALKNTVIPDYDRSKDLIINMNPDGRSGTYINAAYINPFSEFNRIFNALSSGKAPAAGMRDVASIMSDQFFGEGSFMFQSLGNALRNQDTYGRPISVKEDKFASTIDRTKFFFKELLTPGVTRELDKWVEALNGTGDYTENQLLMRLIGIRQTSFSIDDDTRYKIRPSNENMRIIKGRYNNLDENTPEDVRQSLYQKANQDRDASMDKLMTVYDSLKTLGLSDDEAIKTFKDSNVSNSDVIQISQNKTKPIDYVKATTLSDQYEMIEGSTFSETRRNILANTKGNIKVRKALLSKLRQEQTYSRRNISEFDRSLLSLGASERAEMLMNVLGVGATNSVLINEYRRKGIITDDVMKAMRLRGSLASY